LIILVGSGGLKQKKNACVGHVERRNCRFGCRRSCVRLPSMSGGPKKVRAVALGERGFCFPFAMVCGAVGLIFTEPLARLLGMVQRALRRIG